MRFNEIRFEYEGKKYKLNGNASFHCYLPNGDVLKFTAWSKTTPDTPISFENLGQLEVFGSCYTAEEVME